MADSHNVSSVKPLTADTIAAALQVLPRRLEEGSAILKDMTPKDLQDPMTQRAVAMIAGEMVLAALLLRALAEPRLDA